MAFFGPPHMWHVEFGSWHSATQQVAPANDAHRVARVRRGDLETATNFWILAYL
jgi:hypothetical protein